jgi:signal transduction histidine kinase
MTRPRLTLALRESGFLVALLLLTLVLSATLLYQAQAAIQSQSRSSGRLLRDYAAMGAWELADDARDLLERRWSAALSASLARLPASTGPASTGPASPSRSPDAFAAAVRPQMEACGCGQGIVAYFALTPSGDVAMAGGASRIPAEWMRDVLRPALLARTRGIPPADGTSRFGTMRMGERSVVVAYASTRAADGAPSTIYGWVADPARTAPAVLREVLASTPLLPPALVGRGGDARVLSVVATAEKGDTVYAWPAAAPGVTRRWLRAYDERVSVRDTLPRTPEVRQALAGALAGVTVAVAVRPEMAGRLSIEPAGSTRLPLLLGAFALNLVLFAVAVAQLRRQHELARLRSDFVSGVSHELRTPLAQIRLFAELLETGRLSGPQRERSVQVIQRDARRLTYLVENILRFARSERGGERVALAWTEVAPLVREVVHGFAFIAPDVDLRTVVEEGVEARLDAEAFRQVLLNLLENAAKYGPRGQVVTAGSQRVGGRLRVWVDDAGPGIPPADRAKVWQPYHRLERDAGSAAGGSGIGLSIVQRLVRLHGGRAWVGDSPAGGARVVVELPEVRATDGAMEDAGERAMEEERVGR